MMKEIGRFVVATAVCACAAGAQAQVTIETVTVGNPGNVGELSGESAPGGYGPDRICGAVGYVYRIGKFEITAGQYAEFLSAVAATDTYGLYTALMDSHPNGCQITRNGTSGNFTYDFSGGTVEAPGSTEADWANRPVSHVSWGDAARFCNWLHNGQPTGAQDLTTTEDGSYYLNGATSNAALLAVVREPDATWVIPSEDEWYKAAYYDGGSGVYYDFPTGTDDVPSNVLSDPDPDTGNNANYRAGSSPPYVFTIGSPYYRTDVGAFENSASPYGTFDQGGNVFEWNEAVMGSLRGSSGGACTWNFDWMLAAYRGNPYAPGEEWYGNGFRVAQVEPPPIPTVSEWALVAMTLLVLTAGTIVFLRRRVISV